MIGRPAVSAGGWRACLASPSCPPVVLLTHVAQPGPVQTTPWTGLPVPDARAVCPPVDRGAAPAGLFSVAVDVTGPGRQGRPEGVQYLGYRASPGARRGCLRPLPCRPRPLYGSVAQLAALRPTPLNSTKQDSPDQNVNEQEASSLYLFNVQCSSLFSSAGRIMRLVTIKASLASTINRRMHVHMYRLRNIAEKPPWRIRYLPGAQVGVRPSE